MTFTFQSAGLPILLISVIQASIWINFSFPYINGQGLYFLGYLLVSSIQMGANIDYAIIITSRYLDLKKEMNPREAVIEALNQGFPTVITSGTILAVAGILIGYISTDGATAILGTYLGQGTIISIILVIFVLPQLLYLGDTIIERTSFKLKTMDTIYKTKKKVSIQGRLHGYVKGEIDAIVDGTITGEIKPISDTDNELDENYREKGKGEVSHEKTIYISNAQDLVQFSQDSSIDNWSQGMTIFLDADIDLKNIDFLPIPIFSGTFDGQGHTIRGLSITVEGSNQGLFRYLQKGGLIKNLSVQGIVTPIGEKGTIGGIVGNNEGILEDCRFSGFVKGKDTVGGLVGWNGSSGMVINSTSNGIIYGESKVGGIIGYNAGLLYDVLT